jgi:hypothetical protein
MDLRSAERELMEYLEMAVKDGEKKTYSVI